MQVAEFLALLVEDFDFHLVEGFDLDLMEGFHFDFFDLVGDLLVHYSHFLIRNQLQSK